MIQTARMQERQRGSINIQRRGERERGERRGEERRERKRR